MSERSNSGAAVGFEAASVGWRAALTAVALLFCASTSAQPEDAGKFEVLEARHELIDGVYHVSGDIYLRLPSDATRALHASLPLTIRVEAQFLNRLWFWWDNTEFERVVRYRLSYRSLADLYVVEIEPADEAVPSGTGGDAAQLYRRRTFPTLPAALEYIGTVESLPVAEAAELDRNLRYDIRLRAVLDKDELMGPMRLLAIWAKDWAIGSEWQVWRLDAE